MDALNRIKFLEDRLHRLSEIGMGLSTEKDTGRLFEMILEEAKNICNSALSTQVIILIIFYLDVVGYLWLNFIGSFLTVLLAYILEKVGKE